MNIPLVDLRANYHSIKDEIDGVIPEVIETASFIMGKHVKIFEDNFSQFCKVKHVIGCSSGTTAVHLALLLANLQKGDEVITVPNTLKKPFSKADHCYHAAAKVSSWPKDPQKGYVQTNVLGTQSVLDTARETNIERLIYTSSFNALGETGEEPQTEQWDNPHTFTHSVG